MQSATEAAKSHPVSKEEAWSEVEREIQVRVRCYDKWISEGKISWAEARDRLARLGKASQMLKALLEDSAADA
jgi:hypothetical protein